MNVDVFPCSKMDGLIVDVACSEWFDVGHLIEWYVEVVQPVFNVLEAGLCGVDDDGVALGFELCEGFFCANDRWTHLAAGCGVFVVMYRRIEVYGQDHITK